MPFLKTTSFGQIQWKLFFDVMSVKKDPSLYGAPEPACGAQYESIQYEIHTQFVALFVVAMEEDGPCLKHPLRNATFREICKRENFWLPPLKIKKSSNYILVILPLY